MDLAKETKLPIIVHSRDAAKDTLDIMKAEKAENLSGVIHCYAYSKEHAKEYMNMGYYLGIGGVITFPDAKRLKEVVEYAPLDYLLLDEKMLEYVTANGVEKIINVGASFKGAEDSVKLAKKYPFIYAAVGIHPDEVGELDEEKMCRLRQLCDEEKTVAVGEIGLDYHWNKEDHETQKKWFVRQMDLAKETKLPIIVHSRDAAKDTLDIMKAEKAENLSGVIHCYAY